MAHKVASLDGKYVDYIFEGKSTGLRNVRIYRGEGRMAIKQTNSEEKNINTLKNSEMNSRRLFVLMMKKYFPNIQLTYKKFLKLLSKLIKEKGVF